ncbi:MAG: response regulator transcription factor [Flavisolibacter sp.]|jgi:two-component system LytT family response regulator|nr:response regulator transcription factor [Flavisolibacter sp.]
MQIKCVLIDDEPLALEVLKKYINKIPALVVAHSFDDAIAGKEYIENNAIDLLFIDINMPDIKGTDLVRSLRNKPMVIFTTAYKNYAIDGFELDAIDYLVKPIEFSRFEKAAQKAGDVFQYKRIGSIEAGHLFVRADYQLIKINVSDIEYIESVEDYIKIHLATARPVMTLMTMKAVLEKLPSSQFARIHRSYIIPLAKIRSVVNRKITLTSVELPIGNSYYDLVRSWIK